MKGNTNIEELFKQKFETFQPDVNPDLWANIQAGIGAGNAVATGISAAVKIGLIGGGIAAASLATWYFGFYEPSTPAEINAPQEIVSTDNNTTELTISEPIILVNDQNDPVILENKEKIETELRNYQVTQNGSVSDNNANVGVVSNTTVGQTTQNSQPNNNVNQSSENQNNNSEVVPENKKDQMPTGRMEFTQSGQYAPSVVTFVSNARNYNDVRWDFGDGTTIEGVDAKHTYTKAGKYNVRMTVSDAKNSYEETQEIVVKSKSGIDNVPNVITPNGDRINDYFSVKSTDIETFYITITDNHGNEIFSSNDKDFTWDGTNFNGETVEKGLYTYIIIAEGKDGSVIKLPGQIYVQ